MQKLARGALAALLASTILALGAGTALAQLEVSATRIRGTGTLTFSAAEISVVCGVTLGMTLSSERITPGTAAGGVNEARANEAGCTGGRLRLLAETLPWSVRLVEFSQGLIRLQVEGLSGLAEILGISRCLYRGNMQATNDADPVARLRVDESTRLALSRTLGGICPEAVSVRGELTVEPTVAYTETAVRGMPFSSFPNPVNFRRMMIEQGVLMRNDNWILSVSVDGHGILNAPRFALGRAEANECVATRRIAARTSCGGDWIVLTRAKGAGEPEGEYIVKLREKILGNAPLSE